jgi:hypothetical protein
LETTANPDLSSSPCWSKVAATKPPVGRRFGAADELPLDTACTTGIQASTQYSPVVDVGVFLSDIAIYG